MAQKHKVRHTGSVQPKLCGGKRCYSSRQEATIVKTEQEILTPGLALDVYHCVSCGSWHLTRNVRGDERTTK